MAGGEQRWVLVIWFLLENRGSFQKQITDQIIVIKYQYIRFICISQIIMLEFSNTHLVFKKDTNTAHLTLTNFNNYPVLYKVKANHINAIHVHHNRGQIGPNCEKKLTFSKQVEDIQNLNLKIQINYLKSEEPLKTKQQFRHLWEKYGGKFAHQEIILVKQYNNPSIDKQINDGSFPFSDNSIDGHKMSKIQLQSMQSIHEVSNKAVLKQQMNDEEIQRAKTEQRKKLQNQLKRYIKNHDILKQSFENVQHDLKIREYQPIVQNQTKGNQLQPFSLTTVIIAIIIVFILGYLAGLSKESET